MVTVTNTSYPERGELASTLTVTNVVPTDYGEYKCMGKTPSIGSVFGVIQLYGE